MIVHCRTCDKTFACVCPDCGGDAIEAAEPERLTDEEKREFLRILEAEQEVE
jgi:hypothetical protein